MFFFSCQFYSWVCSCIHFSGMCGDHQFLTPWFGKFCSPPKERFDARTVGMVFAWVRWTCGLPFGSGACPQLLFSDSAISENWGEKLCLIHVQPNVRSKCLDQLPSWDSLVHLWPLDPPVLRATTMPKLFSPPYGYYLYSCLFISMDLIFFQLHRNCYHFWLSNGAHSYFLLPHAFIFVMN